MAPPDTFTVVGGSNRPTETADVSTLVWADGS
jgi:hypothetical protein